MCGKDAFFRVASLDKHMRHDLLLVMWKGQAQRVQLRRQVTGGEGHCGFIAERTRIARGPSGVPLVLRLSETAKLAWTWKKTVTLCCLRL